MERIIERLKIFSITKTHIEKQTNKTQANVMRRAMPISLRFLFTDFKSFSFKF